MSVFMRVKGFANPCQLRQQILDELRLVASADEKVGPCLPERPEARRLVETGSQGEPDLI
jgi:hypothetical protein